MYKTKVDSANPVLVIVLIDQSTSTDRIMAAKGDQIYRISTMMKIVTDTLLYTLLRKGVKGTKLKNYVDFAVIGYGVSVHSALPRVNLEEFPINLERLKKEAQKPDDSDEDPIVPRPKREWVEERSDGLTPMVGALKEARKILEKWIPNHKSSYPPTIINLTDGMPNDDEKYLEILEQGYLVDLSETALITESKAIKQLHTDDGNVMIANCHITETNPVPIEYPAYPSEIEKVDPLGRILFDMASTIPEQLRKIGNNPKTFDMKLVPNAKLFLFNADIKSLVNFMSFGTTNAIGGQDPDAKPLEDDDTDDDTKSLPE